MSQDHPQADEIPVASKSRGDNKAALIYDQLRAEILNGDLPPGASLPQPALAQAYGTSRGPVREALKRLQQDHLVVAHSNQRFVVAPFDIGDLEAVLGLHLVVVTLAILVSVPFLTDEDIGYLEATIEAMIGVTVGDETRWEDLYRDFVLRIVQHSGARTCALARQLIDNTQRHHKNAFDRLPLVNPTGPEFRQFVQLAAQRDGERASALYATLMSRMSMLIMASVAPRYDAVRLRSYMAAVAPDGA